MIIFLYDVFLIIILGYFCGWIFSKRLYAQNQFYLPVFALITLLFWLNAILSNTGVMMPWFAGGAYTAETTPLIGVFFVLSYPLWYTWATRLFQYFWGSTPYQNGLFWAVGHEERAKPFQPAWKSGPIDE